MLLYMKAHMVLVALAMLLEFMERGQKMAVVYKLRAEQVLIKDENERSVS